MSNFNLQKAFPTLLLLIVGSRAFATGVSGRVTMANGSPAKYAAVWLEGGGSGSPAMKPAVVDQRDMMFSPHVSVITVGTRIDFPNHDTVFHNVFAEFDAKKFDLGMYARGQTRSITFDKAGLVAILCSVHSEMSAYVMIVDSPYHAVTDAKGRFTIADVPAGNYTLKVWHESTQTYTGRAAIGATDPGFTIQVSRRSGQR
jgi:plastocyanin